MPYKTSKMLPTIDYVSIVASLYKDRRAMFFGTLASVVGAAAAGFRADSILLLVHAAILAVLLVTRDYNMRKFARVQIGATDLQAAQFWEKRALFFGYFAAAAYGSWVFSSIVFVEDDFARLVAIAVNVAAMVGIVTRNYGIDKLMTVQLMGMGGPMVLGLILKGDPYYILLASLVLPMLISFRSLGADVRNNLLNAVHGRVEASRLADQLDTALETMNHGLCMLDGNGVIALVNDQARQIFAGISDGAWVGRTVVDLLDEAIARRALPRATAERLLAMIEHGRGGKIILKLSGDFHCEVTVSTRADRTVLLLENVTSRIHAQERINFMARFDALTSLPNRAHFTEQSEADLAARRRAGSGDPVLLMIVDLDDFKHVNDTLGHLAGDRVLVEAANRIRSVMHPHSQLGRFGGDEFIIYRSVDAGSGSAAAEASSILKSLGQSFDVDGEKLDLRASIGFVCSPEPDASLDDLIMRADLALYRAKARGKGQWLAFVAEMDGEFRYRQRLKSDLADALALGHLSLAYQPIVSLHNRQIVGCEALARWTHAELGPIPPTVFIGLAEEMGLVSDITRWVLETATAQCVKWPDTVSVSVNISARDLRSELLHTQIAGALAGSGLAPHRLEIEVTETALIEEREAAARSLGVLAARGIGIALDDFGTGYSSLSYLHEMPFTKLKIDRSFIADITSNPRSLQLMANVARLGKDLDLVLTVEGVETAEQLALIEGETNIDQVQGYYFGKPMPADEIERMMASMARETSVRGLRQASGGTNGRD
ncbi:putative bifunctional diguanylate cyclase/phosphodiesterase [Pelagibacterium limicola]|uniref:putative bifunctional diguanylate cyclase/phosphodiesterase n=1 Tax=Pelagibacterium limicola TaxID=2791022 RepID=UPI0018AFADCB|nr:EAL domain-containing protein [Pelagibacterium limicola]